MPRAAHTERSIWTASQGQAPEFRQVSGAQITELTIYCSGHWDAELRARMYAVRPNLARS